MYKIINNLNLMSEEELLDPSISAEKLLNGHRAYYYDLFDPPPYFFEKKLEEMNFSISKVKTKLNQMKKD